MILYKAFLTGLAAGVSLCMANISGTVTDEGSTPVSGAVVQLEEGGQSAITGPDGSFTLIAGAAVLPGNGRLLPMGVSAEISGARLNVTIAERSIVEVETFDFTGKTLLKMREVMDAGSHTIALLPRQSAGIYLCKVKAGNNEFVLKGNTFGRVSSQSAASPQGHYIKSLAKQAKKMDEMNDVIAVTKSGYLNYRGGIYNSDTSGIVIRMIAGAGTIIDTDGNVYHVVNIGTQVWTVENLKTTRYNDGTPIPVVTDDDAWMNPDTSLGAYCWYNNDSAASKDPYGALYNWYAVNTGKLAPKGWHVPSDSEWSVLVAFAGGEASAGGALKDSGTEYWASPNMGATNNPYGFSALPGGNRTNVGTFVDIGNTGYWRTSTQYALFSWGYYMYSSSGGVDRNWFNFGINGYSVRCVRDR